MPLLGSLAYKNRGRSGTRDTTSYTDRPASAASTYTQNEVDELENWLSRLDRDRALPSKSALTSPRSPTFELSGRSTFTNQLFEGTLFARDTSGVDGDHLPPVPEGTDLSGFASAKEYPLQRQRSIAQPGGSVQVPDARGADDTTKAARRSSSIVSSTRHNSDTYHAANLSTASRLKRKSVPIPLDLNKLSPATLQEVVEGDTAKNTQGIEVARSYGKGSIGGNPARDFIGNQENRNPLKMSSPVSTFDPTATIASSHSTSSLQSGRSSVNRPGRLQPRSPFASPRHDRRPYAQSMARDTEGEEDDDDSLFPDESSAKVREKLTAAQIIAELDSEPVHPRLRKGSKESFNSFGSSTRSRPEHPRDSLESAASSSRSFQLLGRSASTSPKASLNSYASSSSQVASGSQSYTSQIPMRKPKLQARDDRAAFQRPRPRFISTRSDSSLPMDEDLDLLSSMPDVYSDEPSYPSPTESRRASLSSLGHFQLTGDQTPPIFGSTPARARNSLAVPPPFARSKSHDTKSSTSLTSVGADAQSSLAPGQRDMQQVVLLWVPEEQASSTASGKSGQGHVKALSRVILNTVPGKKKSSRRNSTQLVGAGLVPADPDSLSKEKGKHVATATNLLPLGRWQRCYAVLKPSGAFTLLDYTDRSVLLSVPLTSLQRTDIRQIDQSLLGRQRCLAIYAKGAAVVGESTGAPSSRSHFPTSPSAPEFGSFASMQSSLPDRGKRGHSQKGPGLDSNAFHTVHLAFQTWVILHTWLSAMHVHARPEVYPSLLEDAPHRSSDLQENSLSEGDDNDAEEETASLRQQQSRWRRGHNRNSSSFDEQAQKHFRIYRNITLQINEARFLAPNKERAFFPTTSYSPLPSIPSPTVGFSPMPSLQHEMRRSASIASGSAASIDSSEDSLAAASTEGHLGPPSSLRSVSGGTTTTSTSQLPQQPRLQKKPHPHDPQQYREERAKDALHGRLLYCEVWYEGDVLARTSTRKDDSSVFWHEVFQLSNLGRYRHSLYIHVCIIRDGAFALVGKVEIPLASFRRDVYVEEWFPISIPGPQTAFPAGTHAEVNLKIRVREDFTFDAQMYKPLEYMLEGDEHCKILYSLLGEPSIDIDDIVPHVCRIDIGQQRILKRLTAMARHEVAHGGMTASTLFRGNSLLTKTVEYYMRLVGCDWLDASVGEVLRRICKERVAVEIDPTRIEESGQMSSLLDQVRLLEDTTNSVWSAIYNARHHCPGVLRDLFCDVQGIVDKHFSSQDQLSHISPAEKEKMPFTSISAFVFLRFFVPAILNPRLFGLCPAQPPDTATQRTLTLVAKALQGLANMASFGGKEPWMSVMNPFLQANLSGFQDYIANICHMSTSGRAEWTSPLYEGYTTPLSWRTSLRPDILQEGVATLPLFLDVPRELGCLASTVSRLVPSPPADEDSSQELHYEFVQLCYEINNKMRSRVRAVERSGQMQSSGKTLDGRALIARADTTLRYTASRSRGTTISRSTFQKPLLQANKAPQVTGTSPHRLEAPSNSLESPTRHKRRSHTVSSVAVSATASSPRKAGLASEVDMSSEILEIHLPSHYNTSKSRSPQPIDFDRHIDLSARRGSVPALSEPLSSNHNTHLPGQTIHILSTSPSSPALTPRGNAFPQQSPAIPPPPKSPFFANPAASASANGLEHEIQQRDAAEAIAAKEADKKKTGWARLMR